MKNETETVSANPPPGASRGQLIQGPWGPSNAKVGRTRRPTKPKKLPECIELRPLSDLPFRVHIRSRGVRDFSAQFATLKEATAARDHWRQQVRKLRTDKVNDSVTVADALDGYLVSEAYLTLSKQARKSVDGRVRYWRERLGLTRLTELPGHSLASERDRLVRLKSTSATVCAYLSALSCAWNWAHENVGAIANQVTTIRWPKIRRERPRKFTADQLRHLLKRADGYKEWAPLGLLVRLSLLTTQRRVTCLSPRWHQVDLDSGTIEIPAIKNGRAMSLVITGETLKMLRAHAKATGAKPSEYVFRSPTLNQPMETGKHLKWLFADPRLVDAHGKRLTFKHLRSTSMSRLFTHAKFDLPRAMAITGHKTARVLLEHYAHADTDENRALIEKNADMLLGH
jgi:integrase